MLSRVIAKNIRDVFFETQCRSAYHEAWFINVVAWLTFRALVSINKLPLR